MTDETPQVPAVIPEELVNPLSVVDAEAIRALFEADPNHLAPVDLSLLIAELRARAESNAAELAAEASKPKTKRVAKAVTDDPAKQALRDTPPAQLTLAAIMGGKGIVPQ